MNNPIPLDLARSFGKSWHDADYGLGPDERIAEALAAHLPELAALPAVRDLVLADRRGVDVEVIAKVLHDDSGCQEEWPCYPVSNTEYYRARANRIAAALSDATSGGHWEEGTEAYNRAMKAGLPRRVEYRGPAITAAGPAGPAAWVPAGPAGPAAWVFSQTYRDRHTHTPRRKP